MPSAGRCAILYSLWDEQAAAHNNTSNGPEVKIFTPMSEANPVSTSIIKPGVMINNGRISHPHAAHLACVEGCFSGAVIITESLTGVIPVAIERSVDGAIAEILWL